jgi:hypothetical protein
VGEYFDATGLAHGYLQIGNQFTTVDDPAAVQGDFVNGNNDPGQLVGGYIDAAGLEHGFLATPTQNNSASAATGLASNGAGENVSDPNALVTNVLLPPAPPSSPTGGFSMEGANHSSVISTGDSVNGPMTQTTLQGAPARTATTDSGTVDRRMLSDGFAVGAAEE